MSGTATVTRFTAHGPTLDLIANLVVQVRPAWDYAQVRAILGSHASQVDGGDLALAAIRCAQNLDYLRPHAIGWRGPHWDGLATKPAEVRSPERCQICGRPEPQCYGNRPGLDDDHVFEPPTGRAP